MADWSWSETADKRAGSFVFVNSCPTSNQSSTTSVRLTRAAGAATNRLICAARPAFVARLPSAAAAVSGPSGMVPSKVKES